MIRQWLVGLEFDHDLLEFLRIHPFDHNALRLLLCSRPCFAWRVLQLKSLLCPSGVRDSVSAP